MKEHPHPGRRPSLEEIDLREYLRILVQRRAVVLGCLVVVLGLGVLHSFTTTPLYRATTTVQIERRGPEILSFKDIVGFDQAGYYDYYETQYQILRSRAVLRRAAERLDLPNRPELARRKPGIVSRLAAKVRPPKGPPSGKPDPWARPVGFLAAGLSVNAVRSSHLVAVDFTDQDPRLAAEAADAIAQAYQEFTLDARYETTDQATEFLAKEVARITADVKAAEGRLQAYGASRDLLTLGESLRDVSEQALADLNAKLTDARSRLALAEARHLSARSASPDSLPEVLESELITRLKQQHAEIERQHRQMSQRFKPDWPPLLAVGEELKGAQARLGIETEAIATKVRATAAADRDRARSEVVALQAEVDRQKGEVQRVSREAIEHASLREEIQTKRKVLGDLVARQSETETSGRLKETRASNVRIVDGADIPKSPVRPRKLQNVLVAAVLGLLVGISGALFADYMDSTVKGESDLERIGSLPILAHVPLFQPLRAVGADGAPPLELGSHDDPQSVFAESIRNLRTSLLLASADRPPCRVVITSCEPGDGKSTVAVNLGVTLAQLGRRVAVVDADLRRPRVHALLRVPNDVGLSSYLSGNAEAAELVQETGIPGLRAVSSGPIPPNPSELLGSPRLRALADDLARTHDHVLFDCPPALQVPDPVILSAAMDATIVVVRCGKTLRDSVRAGLARLLRARGPVAGIVLNGVEEGVHYRYQHYYRQGEKPREALAGRLAAASPFGWGRRKPPSA